MKPSRNCTNIIVNYFRARATPTRWCTSRSVAGNGNAARTSSAAATSRTCQRGQERSSLKWDSRLDRSRFVNGEHVTVVTEDLQVEGDAQVVGDVQLDGQVVGV